MDAYTPVIPCWLRTTAYYVALLGGLVGGVLLALGYGEASAVASTVSAVVAGSFGVAYNPSRKTVVVPPAE